MPSSCCVVLDPPLFCMMHATGKCGRAQHQGSPRNQKNPLVMLPSTTCNPEEPPSTTPTDPAGPRNCVHQDARHASKNGGTPTMIHNRAGPQQPSHLLKAENVTCDQAWGEN